MFCRADYEQRERQRQMKNDEERPSPEAASEEFFPGVEPEAAQNSRATRDRNRSEERCGGVDNA